MLNELTTLQNNDVIARNNVSRDFQFIVAQNKTNY